MKNWLILNPQIVYMTTNASKVRLNLLIKMLFTIFPYYASRKNYFCISAIVCLICITVKCFPKRTVCRAVCFCAAMKPSTSSDDYVSRSIQCSGNEERALIQVREPGFKVQMPSNIWSPNQSHIIPVRPSSHYWTSQNTKNFSFTAGNIYREVSFLKFTQKI